MREDVTIEGQDYYFDENAVMQRGLVTRPDGNVYYYDPATGALQRNVTVNVDGTDYTVDGNGIAAVAAPTPEAAPEAASAEAADSAQAETVSVPADGEEAAPAQ